jgi:signal transduction histidine kinase/CheY-like chemotaxis protein
MTDDSSSLRRIAGTGAPRGGAAPRSWAASGPARSAKPVPRPWTTWLSRDFIELLPVAICVCDADGTVVDCNARAAALWGRSPRLGDASERYCGASRLYDLDGAVLPRECSPMARALRSGQPVSGAEFALERPDGSRCMVVADVIPLIDERGAVAGALGCLRELADCDARAGGNEARQLDALRQLTGTVAHDFGNLLAAIALDLNLIEKHAESPALRRPVQAATRAVQRGSELTDQLMTFAGKRQASLEPADLGALFAGMRGGLQRTLGRGVRLAVTADPDTWPALVDPGQVETAMLNLAANARDAMPRGGGLTIATANRRVATPHADLAPGDYVLVSATDTGDGMSEPVLARAFEPFFTTREERSGAGLGLSIVLDVARRHGGAVRIRSRVGAGTTVELYFPRAVGTAKEPTKAAPCTPGARRRQTALLVDDDAALRAALAEVLEEFGCEVLDAADGAAALGILRSDRPVDLMLVDLKMAGLGGLEVVRRARLLRPALKVLVMTGYGDMAEGAAASADIAGLLRKPFRIEELAAEISRLAAVQVLDGSGRV